ncbi:serine hydrolase domain-containing protein [Algoriphagus machipongonensis]|uniref:Beta-lactamase n=1 Tax=Algoriphagus machipongonensis TaxID=388413 RepID=A3HU16_9BACT|nr:serine hydrolase domain-containing protein [Algoriphagus machipongonensis]EAZ81638.1 putative beta-lactamase [Algoriphagus machipongonensis]
MKNLLPLILLLSLLSFSCENAKTQSDPIQDEILAIENGLIPPFVVKGDSTAKMNIYDRMEHYKVPGVSIAVVKDGKLHWAKGYGIANTSTGDSVTTETIFQAGSISKPLAALGALKLVQEGKMALDEDINTYLQGWKVPENKFTETEKVTLERLLTHTAGMTVHGFPGYSQTDTFPDIITVLEGKGNTPPIFVDTIPGSIWRYSGGGYTVMEKAVEDVSGQALEVFLAENVLAPIGMTHSTYTQPLSESFQANASAAYDGDGKLYEGLYHNYPEQAAAGLWTTPSDLAKYYLEIQAIRAGKNDGVLSKEIVDQMLTEHKNHWGLGPALGERDGKVVFAHGGKNAGFSNDMMGYADQGDAIIVMTSADRGTRLMAEILRGISDYYDMNLRNPGEVELADLSSEELENLAGSYQLDQALGEIEEYKVEVTVRGKNLFVYDPNNGDENLLSPTSKTDFVDLTTGDRVEFQITQNPVGMLWGGGYQFYKVEDK